MTWYEDGYFVGEGWIPEGFIEYLRRVVLEQDRNASAIAKEVAFTWHASPLTRRVLDRAMPGEIITPNKDLGVSIKGPGDSIHEWHNDWDGRGDRWGKKPSRIGLFVYLQKTTRKNGCLRVVPKSHRQKYWSATEAVDVMSKPGDVVVLDSRLIHGAHANTTNNHRDLIFCWYDVEMDHPQVAKELESCAALLRKSNQEVTYMKARTKAIRAKYAQEDPVSR